MQIIQSLKKKQKIVKGQLPIATQEDMELYYEKNKNKFTSSETCEVIQYSSKNKAALIQTLKNPMVQNTEVEKAPLVLNTKELHAQMQYILNETNVNTFTPIFTANKQFVSLYILKKSGTTILDFESVKAKIFNDMMELREKKYLKEHFEKQKLTADIKIVR